MIRLVFNVLIFLLCHLQLTLGEDFCEFLDEKWLCEDGSYCCGSEETPIACCQILPTDPPDNDDNNSLSDINFWLLFICFMMVCFLLIIICIVIKRCWAKREYERIARQRYEAYLPTPNQHFYGVENSNYAARRYSSQCYDQDPPRYQDLQRTSRSYQKHDLFDRQQPETKLLRGPDPPDYHSVTNG